MYYSSTPDTEAHLPAWAYHLLALAAAVIGIAASVVTAQFFIVGLKRIEGDAPARHALVAAGVLMLVTEQGDQKDPVANAGPVVYSCA